MMLCMLKSKISYAKITGTELYYEGSIAIDEDLMEQAGILPNEQVHVVNVSNGERLITYAIKGQRGSGEFMLNGAAARKGMIGDELIILAFSWLDPEKEPCEPIVINMKK